HIALGGKMIKGFAHICMHSNDLAKTEDFYVKILGFKKKFNFILDKKVVGFYLDSGNGVFLEFFRTETPKDFQKSAVAHFSLEVDDIDKEIANLQKHGITVSNKNLANDNTWQAWFKDPGGTDIEFHQYTERSTQITNQDCYF
ncbi:MAG: VOC family protein, partial [Chitinivibrionales bacterium]|nr:VOC family protein [Chitinivibrionales bacterium]